MFLSDVSWSLLILHKRCQVFFCNSESAGEDKRRHWIRKWWCSWRRNRFWLGALPQQVDWRRGIPRQQITNKTSSATLTETRRCLACQLVRQSDLRSVGPGRSSSSSFRPFQRFFFFTSNSQAHRWARPSFIDSGGDDFSRQDSSAPAVVVKTAEASVSGLA